MSDLTELLDESVKLADALDALEEALIDWVAA